MFSYYNKVATLAVFAYFTSALFGRQFLLPHHSNNDINFINASISYSSDPPFDTHTPDVKIPIHTLVELLCYMGWIKVAETLLNPFGDDDEDFNVNYLIDRNLQVAKLLIKCIDKSRLINILYFFDADNVLS